MTLSVQKSIQEWPYSTLDEVVFKYQPKMLRIRVIPIKNAQLYEHLIFLYLTEDLP